MLNLYNVNNHQNIKLPRSESAGSGASLKKSKLSLLEKYVDPTGEFPNQELKLATWYIRNKLLLYRITVGGLIGLAIFFWGFSLWRWGDYLIFGLSADSQLQRQISFLPNYTLINEHFKAQPLQVASVEIFMGGVEKYDLVTMAANPNERFLAEFDYYYNLGGDARTPSEHTFLLPGESRPIVYLGYDRVPGASTNLILENFVWHRVNAHEVKNIEDWKKERLNFVVKDFEFTAYRDPSGVNAHIIRFKLMNDSVYGYVPSNFYVGLMQNQSLVGILPLQSSKLRSAETVDVDLRSFAPDLNITDITIYPLINIDNKDVYLPPES